MRSAIAVASVLLTSVLSAPSVAQYRTPVGAQRLERSAGLEPSAPMQRHDSLGRTEINVGAGIAGGVLGGVGGAFLGTVIGASSASGCQGEYCAFGPALLGFGLGEAIGLAAGTHLGARGSGNVALSALTSVGILVGGLLVAAAAPPGTPAIGLTLIPAAQLAAALAMER
jgi:hypothetical protein